MRVIKLIDNKITETKNVLDNYVLRANEIQSETGELGQIRQPDGTFIDGVPPLDQAKASKIAELNDFYNQTLAEGFTSSANGTPITYGFAVEDQTNMSQQLNIVNASIATYPIYWGAKDGETIVVFDEVQFKQLCKDASDFKWSQIAKLRQLMAQVKVATTVEAVNAIVW